MRKAVCKNNRQQVVLKKKKVIDLKELPVRIVVAVGLRGSSSVCERERAEERGCVLQPLSMVNCFQPFLKATSG